MMFTGLTVANVVGVPLGTLRRPERRLARHLLRRRRARRARPARHRQARAPSRPGRSGVRPAPRAGRLPQRPGRCSPWPMTVLGFGGVFAAITYIAPMMTEVAGFADRPVTWLLVLFGLGMVGGNLVGGQLRRPRPDADAVRLAGRPGPRAGRCSSSPRTTRSPPASPSP